MIDSLTFEERSQQMGRIRSRDTEPERQLGKIVWALDYRYRKHRRDIRGNPDLAFVGMRRAIFLHGCFWHRHNCSAGRRLPKSRVDFWKEKFEKNVLRDAQVTQELRRAGWKTLVIWECELKEPVKIQEKVRRFLNAQR